MHAALDTLNIEKPIKITHALRSTFISLAIEDGANDYLLEKVTHTAHRGGRAFDAYAKPNWEALCREVAKISLPKPSADEVIPMASVAVGGAKSSSPDEGCYSAATVDRQASETKVQKEWRRRESKTERGPSPKLGLVVSRGGSTEISGGKREQEGGPGSVSSGLVPVHCSNVAAALEAARERWERDGEERSLRLALLDVLRKLDDADG